MPQVVSTGQITIVDQNDAKPILAIISANGPLQQLYSKDNNTVKYIPDRSEAGSSLTLTAAVYVEGVDVSGGASVTGKKWSNVFNGTSIASNTSSIVVTENLDPAVTPSKTYYFTCTYKDPTTKVESRVDAQITLLSNSLGTNAVYVQIDGTTSIVQSNTSSKNVAAVRASVVRASGYDTTDLKYRWYKIASNGTQKQLTTAGTTTSAVEPVAGKVMYGTKSTALADNPVGTLSKTGFPANEGDWSVAGSPGLNTLIISEEEVLGTQLYKVEVQDTSETNRTYTEYFLIKDLSDTYQINIESSGGDKLSNGKGSSSLTPRVFVGGNELSAATLSGWTFDWYITGSGGTPAGFVKYSLTSTPVLQASVSNNTASSITLNAAASIPTGSLIKLISADKATIAFAQVSSNGASSASVTIEATLANITIENKDAGAVTSLAAGVFAGGTLYIAVATKRTTGTEALIVSEHDVDGKATFTVDANRP